MQERYAAGEDNVHTAIERVMKESLWQFAKLDTECSRVRTFSKENLSTVYTTLDGDYKIRLVFCAEDALLQKIADNMLEETVEDREDVVECAKEFFNVVCGHIVAAIFRAIKVSARFHCPHFAEGYFLPENGGTESLIISCFKSDCHEPAMFLQDKLILAAK